MENDKIENIAVSIVCLVYNHEKYIADAIESFLSQETSFTFEILIHDDASTDGSVDIIKKYAEKEPDIIKPIYQQENQFSQRINISEEYLYPECKGRYIAYCEGDDYWSDPYKLQKQYDILESHPEMDMCVCGSVRLDAISGKKTGVIRPYKSEHVISAEEMIRKCPHVGDFVATNTFFFRKEVVADDAAFRKKMDLDYTLRIAGALRGGAYYLPDLMGVYRFRVPGSWTTRFRHSKAFMASFFSELLDILKLFDEYTKGRYKAAVSDAVKMTEFDYRRALNQERLLLGAEFAEARSIMHGIELVVFYLKAFFLR